jgi:hypothetical protein
MDTRHIKSVRIMTSDEFMDSELFEFPDEGWAISFEVSDEFKIAFCEYMWDDENTFVTVKLADAPVLRLTEIEVKQLWTYQEKNIGSWVFSDQGHLVLRGPGWVSEIPDDVWYFPIKTIKSVLLSMVK